MTQEQIIEALNLILVNIRGQYSDLNLVHLVMFTDGSGGVYVDSKAGDVHLESFDNLAELTDRYIEYEDPEEVKQ